MFYCAHWQTYVSGTLRFGIFDVTESVLCTIVMQLLTGTLGPMFWNYTIPILNIQVKIFPALCTVAGTIFSCTNYFGVIFTGGVGKNGSTIAVSTGFAHFSCFPACCGFPAMTLVFISHEGSIVVLFSIQFFDGLGKKKLI